MFVNVFTIIIAKCIYLTHQYILNDLLRIINGSKLTERFYDIL